MGYDLDRFTSEVNEGLLCCVCKDVLEDPVQGPCEHAYCTACIHGWLVQQTTCPEDRRDLHVSLLRPLFRYMKNDLDSLQIRCRNSAAGCDVVTRLENIHVHEHECEYHTLQCPSVGCTVMLERRQLEEHLRTCDFRTKQCPRGCGLPILNIDDADHNCIAELRNSLELLRSEMICKLEDQQRETEVRVDAMRHHMIQRENRHRSRAEEVSAEIEQLKTTVESLVQSDRKKSEEIQKLRADRAELLAMLRSFLKQHVVKPSSDGEGSQRPGNGDYGKVTLI